MDAGLIAAIGAALLAATGLYRQLFIDPRTSLRRQVDELYNGKRDAEDRERAALRRLDAAERKLEEAEHRIASLEKDRDKWKQLANERR